MGGEKRAGAVCHLGDTRLPLTRRSPGGPAVLLVLTGAKRSRRKDTTGEEDLQQPSFTKLK